MHGISTACDVKNSDRDSPSGTTNSRAQRIAVASPAGCCRSRRKDSARPERFDVDHAGNGFIMRALRGKACCPLCNGSALQDGATKPWLCAPLPAARGSQLDANNRTGYTCDYPGFDTSSTAHSEILTYTLFDQSGPFSALIWTDENPRHAACSGVEHGR